MTPGARVAAAIEILHDMEEGLAAEQALTRWARRSRFAGSKDRAAIRDHVFDVLRQRNLAVHYGKSTTPRALLIGMLYVQDADLATLFTGEGHAPPPLSEAEQQFPDAPLDQSTRWNLPDWLIPHFAQSLGEAAEKTALSLQSRAPVFLRVNTSKSTRPQAIAQLAEEGITTAENPLSDTALTVLEGARKIRNSNTYLTGLVELQDGASQAVVSNLPAGGRVLDYCAGGGGKALALAADQSRAVFAHDIDPRRMSDLPQRAMRAGARITQLSTQHIEDSTPFDVVLCDAPCSGSGAWRRSAEGKWTLTPERLQALTDLQDSILDKAVRFVAPGGLLCFATCSVLQVENEDRLDAFVSRHPDWRVSLQKRFDVGPDGDGFFTAHLMRDP
ncbi:MAG: RsmB/NOP family class I SAM-dependent RNA methyltransferase [Sulfitobacter sp.]